MDALNYLRTHPPRCVAGFNCQLIDLPEFPDDARRHCDPGFEFEDYPTCPETTFRLLCHRGSCLHFIHGYHFTSTEGKAPVDLFVGPHFLECAACGKQTELLDLEKHGYDAELGHGCYSFRSCGTAGVFECRTCGRQPFETLVIFSYSCAEDYFASPDEATAGREQDLFDWVSVGATCAKCSKLQRVTDYECS